MPNDEWATPQDLFDLLNRTFHFKIDAAAKQRNAKCSLWFGPDHPDLIRRDGLVGKWDQSTWINPPFSNIKPWLHKACLASRRNQITAVVILPSDTGTHYFQDYAQLASVVWLLRRRVSFIDPGSGNRTANRNASVLMVFRPCSNDKKLRINLLDWKELIERGESMGY